MQPILQSLISSPLLLGDLPEAPVFDQTTLSLPSFETPLNLDQKLGHLYEDALAILLEASPFYDLVTKSLQLHESGKTTLGELDFLLRDLHNGQLIHLELATKFYLAVETPEGLTLPGPDARDNFFKKLHRLRTHQLILPEKHCHALPEEFREESITTRHLIHGCLFDHIQSTTPATPDFINSLRRQGLWLTITELPRYFPTATRLEIIPKHLWPVPLPLLENLPLESWTPPDSLDRCIMLKIEGEEIPYFVAPADYPERRSPEREPSRAGEK